MTQQMRFDQKLTDRDWKIYEDLWRYLKIRGLNQFTSDTIRTAGFYKHFTDTQHEPGAMIARWKLHGLIIDTGHRVPSTVETNHGRKNSLYRVKGLQDLWERAQQERIST